MCRAGFSHELISTIGISFLATDFLVSSGYSILTPSIELDINTSSIAGGGEKISLKKMLTGMDEFCILPIPVDDLVFENRIALCVNLIAGFTSSDLSF